MKMKKVLKSVGEIVLGLILIAFLFWLAHTIGDSIYEARYFKTLPDYESVETTKSSHCILHQGAPSNFPVLVNTNEGSATPLRLYDTYAEYSLQIREKEEYGVMWMFSGKGWSGAAFPDNDYLRFSIQRDRMFNYSADAASTYFCDECLQAFEELNPSSNFVVVDIYEKENIHYFDIADIEDVEIRHYSFIIDEKGSANFSLEMHSSYYDGGKELDFLDKEDTSEMDKRYDYENLPKP